MILQVMYSEPLEKVDKLLQLLQGQHFTRLGSGGDLLDHCLPGGALNVSILALPPLELKFDYTDKH